jgi:hypothetical protein
MQKSNQPERDAPPPVAPCSIGVIGGSISAGEGLGAASRNKMMQKVLYSGQLGKKTNRTILNRAVPATGSSLAAFCLDQLLPEHVEVLLIEYAINDAMALEANLATSSGLALSPLASMERLLRRVLADRPQTLPIILYVCKPGLPLCDRCSPRFKGDRSCRFCTSSPCDGLYSSVAAHYGVPELTLSAWPSNRDPQPYWATVHPNAGGHRAISILIAEALPRLLSARRPPLPLPKPLHLKTSASSVEEASWQCRTCDWGAPNQWVRPNREPCRNLPAVPDLTLGFRVSGTHTSGHKGTPPANDASLPAPASSSKVEIERVEQLMKAELAARYNVTRPRNLAKQGWLGQRPGDTVAFVIHGGRLGARVMGAFLCSYENVGTASVRLLRGRPGGAKDEVLRAAPAFSLDLDCQWARRSSQQCLRSCQGRATTRCS